MHIIITPDSQTLINSAQFLDCKDSSDIKPKSIMSLPDMTDIQYDSIKYIVEYAGGHWREKYKGFIFDESAESIKDRIFDILKLKSIELSKNDIFQIENQFYPTPDWLAAKMVDLANIKYPFENVLEPSAGKGAILKHIVDKTDKYVAVECSKANVFELKAAGYRVISDTFENYYKYAVENGIKFSKIIMNPPFSNEMDIRHIVLAYNLLKRDGELWGLMAENSIYYNRRITYNFNKFIKDRNGSIEEIPHGSFKDSGTNVDVIMIHLVKKKLEEINIDKVGSLEYCV